MRSAVDVPAFSGEAPPLGAMFMALNGVTPSMDLQNETGYQISTITEGEMRRREKEKESCRGSKAERKLERHRGTVKPRKRKCVHNRRRKI